MNNFSGSRKIVKNVKKELREKMEKEILRSLGFKGVAMLFPFKSKKNSLCYGLAIVEWKDIKKIVKYYE